MKGYKDKIQIKQLLNKTIMIVIKNKAINLKNKKKISEEVTQIKVKKSTLKVKSA